MGQVQPAYLDHHQAVTFDVVNPYCQFATDKCHPYCQLLITKPTRFNLLCGLASISIHFSFFNHESWDFILHFYTKWKINNENEFRTFLIDTKWKEIMKTKLQLNFFILKKTNFTHSWYMLALSGVYPTHIALFSCLFKILN